MSPSNSYPPSCLEPGDGIKCPRLLVIIVFFCMFSIARFSCWFLLLFCSFLGSLQAIEEYEGKRVSEVKISAKGLPSGVPFDSRSVLVRLKTKAGELFSQDAFDEDLKLLSREFYEVDPSIDQVNGQLIVHLLLTPKPTIRSINWSGNEKQDEKKLKKELDIKTGTLYDRKVFAEAFDNVKAYYVKRGFFNAQLNYTVHHDPETNVVDINIHVEEGLSGRVGEIAFVGFSKKEEGELSDLVLTKEYNLFLSWATGKGTLQPDMIQQDELIITDFLQGQGYADATVHIEIKPAKQKNRVVIEIRANKGELYHFGEITISGNKLFPTETLLPVLKIEPGSTFSPQKLRDAGQALTDYYGSKGYIDAYIMFNPHQDEQHRVYNVEFTVEEGRLYRVGMINVHGNTVTHSRVILHESLLVPGEVFNAKKLKQTEERLTNIGYFSSVNVYAVKPVEGECCEEECCEGAFRDVNIELEETGTGSFSIFGGFSTAESVFGGVQIAERNFNWRGIPYVFGDGFGALRGAGEYASINATLGVNQTSVSLAWAKPHFLDTAWTIGFETDYSISRFKNRGYNIYGEGLLTYAKYPINQYVQLDLHHRLRHTHVSAKSSSSMQLREQEHNRSLISAVGAALRYDSTDSICKPHDGFRSSLESEYAGLGGHHHFFSCGYINTYYQGITDCSVLKLRGDIRLLFPLMHSSLNSLPLEERYYLGGEDTVRGYRPFSICPKFPGGAAKGGLTQFLLSAEYAYQLTNKLELFVFIDSGAVSGHRAQVNTMRTTYGFGARVCVLGNLPLMIGMGFPVNAESRSDTKKFFISMGAQF